MALDLTLNGDILEVKETLMGWTDTRISYWYYDIKKWLKSLNGRHGDKAILPMLDGDIAWVRNHYLPRVGIQNEPIATMGAHHGSVGSV